MKQSFLVTLNTPPETNVANLGESLLYLIEEATTEGVWDTDGIRVVVSPQTITEVVIAPVNW